uniref:CSON003084 protein n=1 Tax=Culicoides sonorensis TaxID=179676 RepID=A0A336L284_CULSO
MLKIFMNQKSIKATTYQKEKKNIISYYNKKIFVSKLSDLKQLESGWDKTTTRFLSKLHRRKRTKKCEDRRRKRIFFRRQSIQI